MTLRLGHIDFLNSLPVTLGLERGDVPLPAGTTWVRDVPTTLNAMLARGELDVSPISSIEYARQADDLVLLPDVSINSAGFVHSVTLFYRNDLESVRDGRIAMTPRSATSQVLLRILLERHFGMRATLATEEPDLEELGHSCDGALLIGDDALRAVLAYPNLGRRDLGQEWGAFTGHPMVFALWCARRAWAEDHPEELRAISEALVAGKKWGVAHRADVVEVARKRAWLSRAYMQSYFRHLNYDLDADKLAGLRLYYEHALDLGEIPAIPPLPTVPRAEVRA